MSMVNIGQITTIIRRKRHGRNEPTLGGTFVMVETKLRKK
jgi:hypothetical protein